MVNVIRHGESVTVVGLTSRLTFQPRAVAVTTSHYSGNTPVWAYSADYPAVLAGVCAGGALEPLLDCVMEMDLPGRLLKNLCESLAAQLVG